MMWSHFCDKFFIKLAFLVHLIELCSSADNADTVSPCSVYLTISPISRSADESHLEINWGPNCSNPPEWIGLYAYDPSVSDESPLITVHTGNLSTGSFKTNTKIGRLHIPHGWDREDVSVNVPKRQGPKCLPFYIASYIKNVLQTLDCLKIQPNWIAQQPHLSDTPLRQIVLPGTHCSGCYYSRYGTRTILMKRFGFVQNFDIWTQLVFGIRYLDFSIGYHENKNHQDSRNFWIVNDNLFIASLTPILKDIREFAVLSGEIIILDFNQFPIGFYNYPGRHLDLVKLLDRELGDIAFIKGQNETMESYNLTPNMLRKAGRNVLITYNEYQETKGNSLVWSSWKHYSTLQVKANELKDYMRKIFSRKHAESPKDIGWTFFGVQGVDVTYSPLLLLPSARERANAINRNITYWLSGPWGITANVIALDFFCSSNIVEIAITVNNNKQFESKQLINFDVYD